MRGMFSPSVANRVVRLIPHPASALCGSLVALVVGAAFWTVAPVAATQDTTPPVLRSFEFPPRNIDVSNSAKDVSVSAHLTDDVSGVGNVFASFRGYLRSDGNYASTAAVLARTSVTNTDGTWTGTAALDQYSLPGT